jgi:tRNA threonylcarbamoyladenosine biosynthesis protein TsaB
MDRAVAGAGGGAPALERGVVIVVGIETSTPQVSVAIGNEREILGRIQVAGRARQESVTPALEQLLRWTGTELHQVGGFAVGIGPGLFTGLRVGVETAKTLAQATHAMILGFTSLDTLAYSVRYTSRTILAVVDARRGEVFSATYGPVPGGVVRESDYAVSTPDHVAADLAATRVDVLAVGDGAILYRDVLQEEHGARVEIASPAVAHPDAASLVELAVPRFLREEHDVLYDVAPLYLRKSDAEIAWDHRAGLA